MQLDPVAVAAGVRLIVHAKVGSTNAEALALARAGERGPLWIVARTQSAGRGRRGRQWISEVGNLYATLLIADTAPAADIAQLSFVAALAVHDAIARLTPAMNAKLSLKWPNDVLCDGKKLCGVLLESEGARAPLSRSASASIALTIPTTPNIRPPISPRSAPLRRPTRSSSRSRIR